MLLGWKSPKNTAGWPNSTLSRKNGSRSCQLGIPSWPDFPLITCLDGANPKNLAILPFKNPLLALVFSHKLPTGRDQADSCVHLGTIRPRGCMIPAELGR